MHDAAEPALALTTRTRVAWCLWAALLLVSLLAKAEATCSSLAEATVTLSAWESLHEGSRNATLSCRNFTAVAFAAPSAKAFALPAFSSLQPSAQASQQSPPVSLNDVGMETDCDTVRQYQQYICSLPLAGLAGSVEIVSPYWMYIHDWRSEMVGCKSVNMTCAPPVDAGAGATASAPPCLVSSVSNATAAMASLDWLQRMQGPPEQQLLRVLVLVQSDIVFLESDVAQYWPYGLSVTSNFTLAAPLLYNVVLDWNDLVNVFLITSAPKAFLTFFGFTMINLPTYFYPDVTSRLHLFGMLQSAYWFVTRRAAPASQLILQSSTFVIAYDSFSFWVYWLNLKNSPDASVAALASWAPLTTLNLNEANTGHVRLVETISSSTSWLNMSMANPMVHPVKRNMIGLPAITDSFATPVTAMFQVSSVCDIVIAVSKTIGDLWTRQYGQKIIFTVNVYGNSTPLMLPRAASAPPGPLQLHPSAPPPPPPLPAVGRNCSLPRPAVLQVPTMLTVWPGSHVCWDLQLDLQLLAQTTATPIAVRELTLMNLPPADASAYVGPTGSLVSGMWSFALDSGGDNTQTAITLTNLTMYVPPAELQLYFAAAALQQPEAPSDHLNLSLRGHSIMRSWITKSNVTSYGAHWIYYSALETQRFTGRDVNFTDGVPLTCADAAAIAVSPSYELFTMEATEESGSNGGGGLPGWAIGLIASLCGAAVFFLLLIAVAYVVVTRRADKTPLAPYGSGGIRGLFLLTSLSGGAGRQPVSTVTTGDSLFIQAAGGGLPNGHDAVKGSKRDTASSGPSVMRDSSRWKTLNPEDSFSNVYEGNMIDAALPEGAERVDPETLINRLARKNSGLQDEQLEIMGVLGRGGFGIVYKGQWKGLPVAAKVMIVHEENHESAQSQMLEAMLSTSLSHPNIVVTYKYDLKRLSATPDSISFPSMAKAGGANGSSLEVCGASAWQLLILQELCAGGTLRQMIDMDALSTEQPGQAVRVPILTHVVQLALDVALGLQHLHSKNVVHADLTPKNVLLQTASGPRPDGLKWTAKVADFGLSVACEAGRSHVSRRFAGTPFYIAPETQNEGIVSKQSDVFALGILLSEMMMGPLKPTKQKARLSMPSSDGGGGGADKGSRPDHLQSDARSDGSGTPAGTIPVGVVRDGSDSGASSTAGGVSSSAAGQPAPESHATPSNGVGGPVTADEPHNTNGHGSGRNRSPTSTVGSLPFAPPPPSEHSPPRLHSQRSVEASYDRPRSRLSGLEQVGSSERLRTQKSATDATFNRLWSQKSVPESIIIERLRSQMSSGVDAPGFDRLRSIPSLRSQPSVDSAGGAANGHGGLTNGQAVRSEEVALNGPGGGGCDDHNDRGSPVSAATIVMSLVAEDRAPSSTHSSVLGSARASLPLPPSCPSQYAALVTECLSPMAYRRPTIASVVQILRALAHELAVPNSGTVGGGTIELSGSGGLVTAGPSMLPTLTE